MSRFAVSLVCQRIRRSSVACKYRQRAWNTYIACVYHFLNEVISNESEGLKNCELGKVVLSMRVAV